MNESIELAFKEGSSDKVYHAELKAEGDGYVVNFAYGRRGQSLATGSKTKGPIEYDVAKSVYEKLIKSKVSKGYQPDGASAAIAVVTDKVDTGIRPQLLNEIPETEIDKYISNDRYCMQEKNDGRRKMLSYTGTTVTGVNKKGFEIPVVPQMMADCQTIKGAAILDGEDMGHEILLFDMISYPDMRYIDRLEMLKELVRPNLRSLRVVATAFTSAEKQEMYNELKRTKAEGVVFKLKNAAYSAGRPNSGGTQLKCKFYESASCVVTSVSDVKSSIGLSVLDDMADNHMALNSLTEVGNTTIYPNQVTPILGEIVEVKYLYYFPGGSLYQPVLLGVRDDVEEAECLMSKLKTRREE
jgi:bifunctional non-homologous end joining protein LigD